MNKMFSDPHEDPSVIERMLQKKHESVTPEHLQMIENHPNPEVRKLLGGE